MLRHCKKMRCKPKNVTAPILARASALDELSSETLSAYRPKLVREYEKGGMAASPKAAMDRAID